MSLKTGTDLMTLAGTQSRLQQAYLDVRKFTELLCEPLSPEDCVIQSMPDVSPIRWHLAHTTWFFETFVLAQALPAYQPWDEAYEYLFNSYYNSVGEQFPRHQRGMLSRPSVKEVFEYRHAIDVRMQQLLETLDDALYEQIAPVVEIGLHHEQQHQELMLTDIKHVLSCNPLFPSYDGSPPGAGGDSANGARTCSEEERRARQLAAEAWLEYGEGLYWIGHTGQRFSYDNETPRHRQFLESFQLAPRLVTCGQYLEFIEDGGYDRSEHWLSDGWAQLRQQGWTQPLYWVRREEEWHQFTLSGLRPLVLAEPVCHVSYFEADAFVRWSGGRLPTEVEWEVASESVPIEGNFVEAGHYHPLAASGPAKPLQIFGDVWEWTASHYSPYPGYRPAEGALGEYNGKFMCNQFVLRGGSCATSENHIRPTYRNFFPPDARWQFSGLRLAR